MLVAVTFSSVPLDHCRAAGLATRGVGVLANHRLQERFQVGAAKADQATDFRSWNPAGFCQVEHGPH
jgi:hypothetical protein